MTGEKFNIRPIVQHTTHFDLCAGPGKLPFLCKDV